MGYTLTVEITDENGVHLGKAFNAYDVHEIAVAVYANSRTHWTKSVWPVAGHRGQIGFVSRVEDENGVPFAKEKKLSQGIFISVLLKCWQEFDGAMELKLSDLEDLERELFDL